MAGYIHWAMRLELVRPPQYDQGQIGNLFRLANAVIDLKIVKNGVPHMDFLREYLKAGFDDFKALFPIDGVDIVVAKSAYNDCREHNNIHKVLQSLIGVWSLGASCFQQLKRAYHNNGVGCLKQFTADKKKLLLAFINATKERVLDCTLSPQLIAARAEASAQLRSY